MQTSKALVYDPTELTQERRTRMTRSGPRTQVYYHAPCLHCGRLRPLQLSDLDTALCGHCQRIGVLASNYESNIERLRQRQIKHTSGPEARLIGTLHSFALPFERQVLVPYLNERGQQRHYLLDFVVAGLIAVEVNGAYYPNADAKTRRDAHLKTICPLPLVFMFEEEMIKQPRNYYLRFEAQIEGRLRWNGEGYEYMETVNA